MTVAEDAAAQESVGDFGGFLRAAGKLAVGRQVSALCLIVVVFLLPALTTSAIATDFVWAYFAMLTLTSLLGIGLERLAGAVVANRGDESIAGAIAPVVSLRLVTLPVVGVALWLLFTFVGVTLSSGAWWATFMWVLAGLLSPVLFGGLRAAGNSRVEPTTMIAVRAAQAVLLAGVAVAGGSVALMVASVALIETFGVVAAARALGPLGAMLTRWARWRDLPLRQAYALAGIEAVGVLNLRADLLLVGHMLGAAPGATYGMLYRAVDGFYSVVGSAGVWLYAEGANARDGGTDPRGIRARSLAVIPRFGIAAAAVVVLCSEALGSVAPRLGAQADTLRILAVAFPILSLNVVELHVRSGRGRNREVLTVNTITLVVNVGLCIGAISAFGLPGAAAALAVSEFLQAGMLWIAAEPGERALVGPALRTVLVGTVLLVAVGVAVSTGAVALAVGALLALVVVVARPVRLSGRRSSRR